MQVTSHYNLILTVKILWCWSVDIMSGSALPMMEVGSTYDGALISLLTHSLSPQLYRVWQRGFRLSCITHIVE